MFQDNYIELSKLIKTLEQELLKSSLKIETAELELKVVVNQENGEMRIYILDSGSEADWKNLHTLKVKVFQDTGNPSGGRTKIDTDQDPGTKPGGSGHSPSHSNPPQDSGTKSGSGG